MSDQQALLEYISSSEGINKIVVGIIVAGAINAMFMTYSIRRTYGAPKKEREKLKIQQFKIDKLSPTKKE